MTRKRFVKLLMSHGLDRNSAVLVAEDARKSSGCYEAACMAVVPCCQYAVVPKEVAESLRALGACCEKASQALAELNHSLEGACG